MKFSALMAALLLLTPAQFAFASDQEEGDVIVEEQAQQEQYMPKMHFDLALSAHEGDEGDRQELCNHFKNGLISLSTGKHLYFEKLFHTFEGKEFFSYNESLTDAELLVMGFFMRPLPDGFRDYVHGKAQANDGNANLICYVLTGEHSYLSKSEKLGNGYATHILALSYSYNSPTSFELHKNAVARGYLGASICIGNTNNLETTATLGQSTAQKLQGQFSEATGDLENAGAFYAAAYLQGEPLDGDQVKLAKEYMPDLEKKAEGYRSAISSRYPNFTPNAIDTNSNSLLDFLRHIHATLVERVEAAGETLDSIFFD